MTAAADGVAGGTVDALVFDVFGTVVDWRGSIVREGRAGSWPRADSVDWEGLADAWRAGYQPAMASVRNAEAPWSNLDALNRTILDALLPRFGLDDLAEPERERLNRVWHRLAPWPDAVAGLQRLKSRYTIATLSNGNVSLLVDMAKRAGLPWDCVLSAEIFRRYKPDPAVYLGAVEMLGCEPGRVAMVAAHPSDLEAARKAGLKTAYVARPFENGPGSAFDRPDKRCFDWHATDFGDLAGQLEV